MIRLVLPALVALVLVFAGGAAADHDTSPPVVTYALSGSLGDNGWYRGNVSVLWTVTEPQGGLISTSGCEPAVLVTTEGATNQRTCVAQSHGGTTTIATAQIKIDKTPPSGVGISAARPPDVRGWYNRPVTVSAAGADSLSGLAGCSATTYSGPDTGSGSVSGTCRDVAGNVSGSVGLSFKYDATPPADVTATPARGPDVDGWFNAPVQVRFAGADATSGIAACDAPTYAGPDGKGIGVTGACEDVAGNRTPTTLALSYDATAPQVARFLARPDAGFLSVEWDVSPDTTRVELARRVAAAKTDGAVVFRGRAARFRDTKVAPKAAYRYVLAAYDQAGNVARQEVRAVAPPRLYQPRPGRRVGGRPVLAWKPVAKARYYNVQLFRGRTKVLSVWPAQPRLKLPRRWVYLGSRHRLTKGAYRWFVWPGYGARTAQRYGKTLGQSRFVYTG